MLQGERLEAWSVGRVLDSCSSSERGCAPIRIVVVHASSLHMDTDSAMRAQSPDAPAYGSGTSM